MITNMKQTTFFSTLLFPCLLVGPVYAMEISGLLNPAPSMELTTTRGQKRTCNLPVGQPDAKRQRIRQELEELDNEEPLATILSFNTNYNSTTFDRNEIPVTYPCFGCDTETHTRGQLYPFDHGEYANATALQVPVLLFDANYNTTTLDRNGNSINLPYINSTYPEYQDITTSQNHLKRPERTYTGEENFTCPLCYLVCTNGRNLTSHIKWHIGGKAPFTCPYSLCNKVFKNGGNFTVHIRVHNGEKPYTCPYAGCSYAAAHQTNLKNHIKTHTGERPYKCPYTGCDKKFITKANQTDHTRTHTK